MLFNATPAVVFLQYLNGFIVENVLFIQCHEFMLLRLNVKIDNLLEEDDAKVLY